MTALSAIMGPLEPQLMKSIGFPTTTQSYEDRKLPTLAWGIPGDLLVVTGVERLGRGRNSAGM